MNRRAIEAGEMDWEVVEARVMEHGSFQVRFADGLEGVVRFAPSAFRGVFAKLRDPAEFNKLYVNDYLSPGRGNLI